MKRRLILLGAALLVTWVSPAAAQAVTFRVDGVPRQALVFAPKFPSAGARLPVVFAFHGRGDEVQYFQAATTIRVARPSASSRSFAITHASG